MRRTQFALFAMAGLTITACGPGAPKGGADGAVDEKPADRSLTLASGTAIEATTARGISSRQDKAGETFTASVSNDVSDASGRVVIPAGSTINLTITELQPANDNGKADGRIKVAVNSVSAGGQTYPVSAEIT